MAASEALFQASSANLSSDIDCAKKKDWYWLVNRDPYLTQPMDPEKKSLNGLFSLLNM